jgi:hypothetical protein
LRLNGFIRVVAYQPSLLSCLVRFAPVRAYLLGSLVYAVCRLDGHSGAR